VNYCFKEEKVFLHHIVTSEEKWVRSEAQKIMMQTRRTINIDGKAEFHGAKLMLCGISWV